MITSTRSDSTRKVGCLMVTRGRSCGRVIRVAQIFGSRSGSSGTTAITASRPPRLTIRR